MINDDVSLHLKGSTESTFMGILKSEFRKAFDTRASLAITLTVSVLTIGMTVLSSFMMDAGEPWLAPFKQVSSPLVTITPLLLILLVCEEWDKGSALITFTQVPKRWRALLGKTVVAVCLLMLSCIIALLLTLVSAVSAQGIRAIDIV